VTAPPGALLPLGTRVRRARVTSLVGPLAAALAVLVFWWGATGVLLALQRSAYTRLAALAVAAAAAAAGVALTMRARRAGDGAGAGAGAVLAGALLWTAVSAAFTAAGWSDRARRGAGLR
jgi:hypothetical protein